MDEFNTKRQTVFIPEAGVAALRNMAAPKREAKKLRTPKRQQITEPARANAEAAVTEHANSDLKQRIVVCGAGALLLLFGVLASSGRDADIGAYLKAADSSSRVATEMAAFSERSLRGRKVNWPNPTISYFESNFCRGNKTAASCDQRELHPYIEIFKYIGIEVGSREELGRWRVVTNFSDLPKTTETPPAQQQ